MPEISETPKGSFTKFFGSVRQKIFDGNLWYPLLCIKFFDTPNFMKHWRDAHEIFRHYETNNFWRKNVIPPFSSIKLFENKNFLSYKNSRIPLRKFSALWDIKNSTENRDMPPLIHNFFWYQKISGKQKGSCTKLFVSVMWDKKFRQNRDAPPPPMHENFRYKNFSETPKCSPMKHFGTVRQKISTGNLDTPPPFYPNFFDTRN